MKRYKDFLKATLRLCNIDLTTWNTAALRSSWRRTCYTGV